MFEIQLSNKIVKILLKTVTKITSTKNVYLTFEILFTLQLTFIFQSGKSSRINI